MQFPNKFYCLPCLCDFNFISLLILVNLLLVSDSFFLDNFILLDTFFACHFCWHLQLLTLKHFFPPITRKTKKQIKVLHKSYSFYLPPDTSIMPYHYKPTPSFSMSLYVYKWVFYFLWLNLLELFPRVQIFYNKNYLLMDESNGLIVINILLTTSDAFDHIRFYLLSRNYQLPWFLSLKNDLAFLLVPYFILCPCFQI